MPAAKIPKAFQDVVVVPVSDDERDHGTLSEENVGVAISAMHRDGLCVLENAVNPQHVDKLNKILMAEAREMATLPTTHFNDNSVDGRPTGNMSQGPPLNPQLMYGDVWANGPAVAVMECLLGPRPHVNYVNGNTALGGYRGARQKVHADLSFNHGTFPFGIVTNYYLMDVSPANGSTELWLGTHRDTTFADHRNCLGDEVVDGLDGGHGDLQKQMEQEFGIRPDLLEVRRGVAPPIQPTIKRGSVVLRDLRLWHAGLCNPSPDPRIMLAFVHTPWWYQCPAKVVLPEGARALVDRWSRQRHPVQYDALFMPADLDHKAVKFNPNFSSKNKGFLSMRPNLPDGFIFGLSKEEEEELMRMGSR